MKRLFLTMFLVSALAGSAHAGGSAVFASHCAVCHRPQGQGVPGTFPPLAASAGTYLRAPGGREYLVHVVSFGMMGEISVKGRKYSGFMQAWTQLSEEEVAEVVNYILTGFNAALLPKDFHPLTAEEVGRLRAAKLSPFEVRKQREALIKAGGVTDAPQAPGP